MSIDYRGLLDEIAKVIEVNGEEGGGYFYADLPDHVRERLAEIADPYSERNQAASAWTAISTHPLIGDLPSLPERGTYAESVRARLDEIAAISLPEPDATNPMTTDGVRVDARRRAGLNLDPIQRKWDAWNERRLPNSELMSFLALDVPQLMQEVQRERQLVNRLLDELDCLETDLEAAAYRHVQLQARIGKRDRTLARIQAVAADVDQDGGHSGPSLARHILNIIGGEA